jgi:hypothetical protein
MSNPARKEYKGRLVTHGHGTFIRLYGPRRKFVDVLVDHRKVEGFTGLVTTTDAATQAKLDEALRMYSGPTGIWEEERRLA